MQRIILVSTYFAFATALTGYECGKEFPNVTTISLETVGTCEFNDVRPKAKSINLQLIQFTEHKQVYVTQCRIKEERRINYCGMHSHTSEVKQGETTTILTVSRTQCENLHQQTQFKYFDKIIDNVRVNATTRTSLTIAGILKENGECYGTTFVTENREYSNVVATAKLEITLMETYASANVVKDTIHLASGTACKYSKGYCLDAEETYNYWKYEETNKCDFKHYTNLYKGLAIEVKDTTSIDSPTIYFSNSTGGEVQFSMIKTGQRKVCGYTLFSTEHPNLFIYIGTDLPSNTEKIPIQDISITAYFNTKLNTFSRHIKSQFESLYTDIILHRCQLERQNLMTSLNLIDVRPDLTALTIMKDKGYMIVSAGEAAHIIHCRPVACKLRHTDVCYEEIPVYCNNATAFLKPQTRIMTTVGVQRDCHPLVPRLYNFDGIWHQLTPTAMRVKTPDVLQPMRLPTWKYEEREGLVENGIYAQEDLENLREQLLYKAERPALLEAISRKLTNKETSEQGIFFDNLLNSQSIEKFAESKLNKIWNNFVKFGNISSGIIMILLIIQLIKIIIDTAIQGYTIWTIYGWSIQLLGAIFSSITNLLTHLANNKKKKTTIATSPPKPAPRINQPRSWIELREEVLGSSGNDIEPRASLSQ